MGKVRTRIIGLEDVEKKQKKDQKKRLYEKKSAFSKSSKEEKSAEEKVDLKQAHDDEAIKADEQIKEQKKVKKVVKKAKERPRGKGYQKAKKLTEADKKYTLAESLGLLKKMKYTKFDESVELHLNLTKKGLRGEVSLPHSIGKETRAAIVNQKVLDDIENGIIEFDVLISEPSFMPKLAKHAKILGPRGLMPSPKTGTISDKPQEVLKKYTGGFIKWKSETEAPLLHQMVGKISHDDKQVTANIQALINAVGKEQIENIFIKTTMSPSLKLDIDKL